MARRIVVLGATGFLGAHVARRLQDDGHDVLPVGRRPAVPAIAKHVALDLFQADSLDQVMEGADACVHLATDLVPSSAELAGHAGVQRNLALGFKVAEACVRAGVRNLLFASSGGTVYGQDAPGASERDACRPIGLYGVQKLANEAVLRSVVRGSACQLGILRIGNPYGPGQEQQKAHGIIGHLLDALIHGRQFTVWGDGSQVRDYVWIGDVEEAFVKALDYSGAHDVFNIGSGIGVSTSELIRVCQEVASGRIDVSHDPHRPYDVDRVFLDIALASAELRWQPRTALRDGISRYYNDLIGNEK